MVNEPPDTPDTTAPPTRARKPPIRLETERRLEWIADLLRGSPGLTSYQACSRIRDAFKISRRTAQDLLARVRETLAQQNAEQLRELATELPGWYRDLLTRCREADDRRTEARVLAGIANITGGVDPTPLAPTPHKIEFVIASRGENGNLVIEADPEADIIES